MNYDEHDWKQIIGIVYLQNLLMVCGKRLGIVAVS